VKAGNACEDAGNGNEGHGEGEVFDYLKCGCMMKS